MPHSGSEFNTSGHRWVLVNFGGGGTNRPVGPKPERITASTEGHTMPGDVIALTTLPDQHNGTLNTVGVTARPAGRPTVDAGGMTMTYFTSETKQKW